MTPSAPLKQLAALLPALMAGVLSGCPDTSVDLPTGSGGSSGSSSSSAASSGGHARGPVGKLKLVQTFVAAQAPAVTLTRGFVMSLDDTRIYAATWHGDLLTFDRSLADGSLALKYTYPVFNALDVAITPDGTRLFASGANTPDQIVSFDLLQGTEEPTKVSAVGTYQGGQLAMAGEGTILFESQVPYIQAYRIDTASGSLAMTAQTSVDSPMSNFSLFVDDAHHALYAQSENSVDARFITRYAIDTHTGALTMQAQTVADLWWCYVQLALCPGTTRLYVPQEMGNIGYADVSGTGLTIPASFSHADLAHVRSVALSPDCKNLYALTQQAANGSVVVLTRDDAGDLTWLQTIPMGPGAPLDQITEPSWVHVSADGKNVYVASYAANEGFAVFQRDTTGAGFP